MVSLYKKILCPVDFSPFSAVALKQAASIAQIFSAKLVLAHIITNPWADQYKTDGKEPVTPNEVGDVVKKKIKEFADIHVPNLSFEILVTIHEHTYKGLIEYASLVEYASNEHVDLIVLSTHGYADTKNLFLGSVAESVVRQAPCSVLVVRDPHL
jgi:universal stress protein A